MSKEIVFKQSCLIRKNTPELRDKLSDLGYKVHKLSETEDREYGILCNGKVAVGIPDNCREFNLDEYLKNNPQIIDCGKNEDLFLAIAALRDDSDRYQFFVLDEDIPGNKKGKFILNIRDKWYVDGEHEYRLNRFNALGHKATVEELINYFKNE